jgi:PleD family two-component response regulator
VIASGLAWQLSSKGYRRQSTDASVGKNPAGGTIQTAQSYPQQDGRGVGSQEGIRKMRTLIVEDNHTNRLLLQSVLSIYGECHIAVNGREAVAAFRVAQERGKMYDLICMDIMMPEMDGQTALK